ncbi:MAG: DHA2 family efflux MFS transporter permease subunit [Chloroflexi bacterium]|nr:DHA2 family efflux MFS transporter permease subunit [Chloroflexota bacterium]
MLFVACVGSFATTLDSGMVSVAYPALASAFGTNISAVVWVTAAYFLTSTSLFLTVGWVGDVLGRRRIFILGFIIYSLGIGLSALSTSILMLIFLRVFQAIGSSMIVATTQAIAVAAFPGQERGKAIGILNGAVGLGLAGGPFLGGILLDTLGWPAIFYTRVPIGLLGAVLSWVILQEGEERTPTMPRVDFMGAFLLLVSVASFLLMVNQAGRLGLDSPLVWALAGAAVFFLPVFLLVERRAQRPILDFQLFRYRAYSLSMVAILFHFLTWSAVTLLAPFYFLGALGFSQARMGLALSAFQVLRILVGPASGWLSDRVGTRVLTTVGMLVLSSGLLLLGSVRVGSGWPHPVLALLVMGLGTSLFEPANSSAVMGSAPRERLGTAAASIATSRGIALASGVALSGAIFTLRSGSYEARLQATGISADALRRTALVWGFRDAVLVCFVLALVAVAASAMRIAPRSARGQGNQ